MEKFKERRVVKIMDNISITIGLMFFLSLLIGMFYNPFLVGFLLLPVSIIPILISKSLSKKNEYTREFMSYIKDKAKKAKSLDELNQILNEFESLAIEGNMICLSFPLDLKIIHRDIVSKIEILEILAKNNGDNN